MFYFHAPSASIKIFILLICIILFYIHFILKCFYFFILKHFSPVALAQKLEPKRNPTYGI